MCLTNKEGLIRSSQRASAPGIGIGRGVSRFTLRARHQRPRPGGAASNALSRALSQPANHFRPMATTSSPCRTPASIPASVPNLTRSTVYCSVCLVAPFPLQLTTRLGLAIQLKQVAKGANLRSFLYHARDLWHPEPFSVDDTTSPSPLSLSLQLTTLFSFALRLLHTQLGWALGRLPFPVSPVV